jgi:hypothetical protein
MLSGSSEKDDTECEDKKPLLSKTEDKEFNSRPGFYRLRGIIWSVEDDTYLTLTSEEWRINATRVFMKFAIIALCFAIYYIAWAWYAMITFVVAVSVCTLSCLGIPCLTSACYAGILASLLHGVRLGNDMIHVDIKWRPLE